MTNSVTLAQPRILAAPSRHAHMMTFALRGTPSVARARAAVLQLVDALDPARSVVGVGAPLVQAVGASVPGSVSFSAVSAHGVSYPSTQGALWLALYGKSDGDDPGHLLHEARRVRAAVDDDVFVIDDEVDVFSHRGGRDLTGFIDGTANPTGTAATDAALVDGAPGLAGSSFVLVQRWVHDLAALERMSIAERERMVGRRLPWDDGDGADDEVPDAPPSAHVKRTEQEAVGFLLRRS